MSPKITRHGGASDRHDPEVAAAAETEPTPEAAADQPEPADDMREDSGTGEPMHAVDGDEVTGDGSGRALPPADETADSDAVQMEEGGEESSPGSNSSTSTKKQSATSAKSKAAPRKRTARVSRSTADQTDSSSPDSPDTSGPATEPPTDDTEA